MLLEMERQSVSVMVAGSDFTLRHCVNSASASTAAVCHASSSPPRHSAATRVSSSPARGVFSNASTTRAMSTAPQPFSTHRNAKSTRSASLSKRPHSSSVSKSSSTRFVSRRLATSRPASTFSAGKASTFSIAVVSSKTHVCTCEVPLTMPTTPFATPVPHRRLCSITDAESMKLPVTTSQNIRVPSWLQMKAKPVSGSTKQCSGRFSFDMAEKWKEPLWKWRESEDRADVQSKNVFASLALWRKRTTTSPFT